MKGFILTASSILLAIGALNVLQSDSHFVDSIPVHIHTLYSKWTVKYGALRSTPSEHLFRLNVFYKTHLEIQDLRKRMPTAEFGLNSFADITIEEFGANMLGYKDEVDQIQFSKRLQRRPSRPRPNPNPIPNRPMPASYVVPGQRPIGNQGMCGSCWAWATKHLTQDAIGGAAEVSAQNIMNCNANNHNCNGGGILTGLQSIQAYGYRYEQEEPYRVKAMTCRGALPRKIPKTVFFTGFVKSEQVVKQTMMTYNTGIGVGVKSENQSWKSYRGGVFSTTDASCRATSTDHVVTIVGFDNRRNAWKLRNSWGSSWGEQGYMWLQINSAQSSPGKCYCGGQNDGSNCIMAFWK